MSVTRLASSPGFTVKGWHVLVLTLAFFGVVIGVNALFITMAVRSFPGEVVKKSYVQGLAYNDTLAERRAQAALGWTASAAIEKSASGAATLAITLADREANPLPALSLSGRLLRPVSDEGVPALAFRETAPGRYEADLGALPPGAWQLSARAERGSERLDVEARLTW